MRSLRTCELSQHVLRATVCIAFLLAPTLAVGQTIGRILQRTAVFRGPNEQSAVIATVDANTAVEIHAMAADDPNWVKVTLPGVFPRLGYVAKRLVSLGGTDSQSIRAAIKPTPVDQTPAGAVVGPAAAIGTSRQPVPTVETSAVTGNTASQASSGTIAVHSSMPPPAASSKTTVHLSVALVDADLNIKAVPRHVLLMKRESDSEPLRVTTGNDGKAAIKVEAGEYSIRSERPVDFQGKSYHWNKTVRIGDGDLSLELSSDSAEVASLSSAPARSSRDLPTLFKQWQGSVVTVWGETGHGSGFLIDRRGLIATNQHVVANFDYASIQIDEHTKVAARIVARSSERDIAILWVAPDRVEAIQPTKLGFGSDGKMPVVEGEQVFTIGSPLHQRKVMTTGIVSKLERHVIISDVNINHGNSGGPLFTMDGTVIGITTFGDLSEQGGPGISGIVRIDEALPLIRDAEKAMSVGQPPASSLLPVEPTQPYPVDGLKELVSSRLVKTDDYLIRAIGFDVMFITPVLTRGVQYAAEQANLKERSKRNGKATAAPETMKPLSEFRNWEEYVGENQPVVMIRARPKLVEGVWSAVGRGLAAAQGYYGGPAKLHFKTDFFKMQVFCGNEQVMPIHPGKVEHHVAGDNAAVRVNDATYEGLYTFAPDALGPHCATVRIDLYNEKDPTKVAESKVIPPKLVQRVWDDFAPFRAAARQSSDSRVDKAAEREKAAKSSGDRFQAEVTVPQEKQAARQSPTKPAAVEGIGQNREGFWFNGGLAFGSAAFDRYTIESSGLSGGLSLGGTLNDRVILGVGTTGFSKSDGISTVTIGTIDARFRFYPGRRSGFFITGGLGVGSLAEAFVAGGRRVGGVPENSIDYGVAVVVGLGWDIRVKRNLSLTPFWNGINVSNVVGVSNAVGSAGISQFGLGITIH